MKNTPILSISILAALLFGSCTQKQDKLSPDEARQIARESFVYGFPMVMNYKTMYMYALDENSPEYRGQFNYMSCEARLFTPEDKAVVTPNSDTPYCMFWVDLRQEPQVITVPEVEARRYYSFQLIDLYTHNFAYLGTLTTGNQAGTYLMVNTGWEGQVPEGVDSVMTCETDLFFGVVRTQLMDENDMENVRRIQETYQIQGLSAYLGEASPEKSESDEFPQWKEGDQFTSAAFIYLDFMLGLTHPVASEKELRERMSRLGIGSGEGYDESRFDEEIREAITEGVQEGLTDIEAFIEKTASDPLGSAKIFGTREFLTKSAMEHYQMDDFYILRAAAADRGLYGNSGFEALYPTYALESPGQPFNAAEHNYTLTFMKDQLPPVQSFWSLSMYDGKTQLFIHNALDRYLLNSNDMDGYVYNEDGSLTLYIQKDSPGKDLESNWLPAPDGPFYCVLRLYGPAPEAQSGEWTNPPLVQAD